MLDFWKIKLWKSSLTNWIFSLQKFISKFIFAGYRDRKNPVWNRFKIRFIKPDFSEINYRSTGGLGGIQVAHGLHELKTHQGVMHYSGRAIMSESHKIGRNWIVYLMERCNIVKVLRYKTENMGIELQILFHSSLLLSNRFMPTNISLPYNFTLRWILLSQIIHKSLYLSTQE